MFFKQKQTGDSTQPPSVQEARERLTKAMSSNPDLTFRTILCSDNNAVLIAYLVNLVDIRSLSEDIIKPIQKESSTSIGIEELNQIISTGNISAAEGREHAVQSLLTGAVYLYSSKEKKSLLVHIPHLDERSIDKAETESLVFGPKISFTESIGKNINMIRANINDPKLRTDKVTIGERVKTEIRIVYIEDIADPENVQTVKQRISGIVIDDVLDSSVLVQLIEDNSFTIFPQFLLSELPDRFSYSILRGKVGILVDRSPTAILTPTQFLSFFESTEDVYMRWNLSTFIRFLRFAAMLISVFATPAYVAALTYHYEVIPSALMISLGQSRANVPFPPVFEALLFEFIIELLREAGARLPTKVGQTMGIVGGIVIGQASVQAGFTSNILIIIIALSALGSFTAPSYMMGSAIRIARFPMIILAGFLGLIGIMFGLCFILLHLLKLTTLGRPYLAPIYPFRKEDLKYSLFRLPVQYLAKRPITNSPIDYEIFPRRLAEKKRDTDE
ncbi:spore germination protein [Metabacillus dongyingensis]|uniref:spore germination protein n=1 Tax=Metabacillus dongyingensis TaxID=2874282 RepID=UPI003B8DE74E